MTLQWTLVALFLYIEIAFLLLLMLPWIRAPRWKQIFNSRLVRAVEQYSTVFYYATGGILLLLFLGEYFLNMWILALITIMGLLVICSHLKTKKVGARFDYALREVRKYGTDDLSVVQQFQVPHADAMMHMRLFRAQRNLYIAGFALFLYLVCRRMAQMLILEANLMASSEASLKQAQGAAKAAQALLDTKKDSAKKSGAAVDEEKKDMQMTIDQLRGELDQLSKDRESFKERADSMQKDYDLLLKEYDKLKKTASSDKKAD